MAGTNAVNRSKRTLAGLGNGHSALVTAKKTNVAQSSRKPEGWRIRIAAFNALSQEELASALPFCVAKNVSLEQFHKYCDKLESDRCFRWEFVKGHVQIYEMAHAAHDRAAAQIIWEFGRQLVLSGHDRDVVSAATPKCVNNVEEWSYAPDGSLTVDDFRPGPGHADAADRDGNRWPNIVVEVAHWESEPNVLDKARQWLDTAPTNADNGVQQVIVVKIGTKVRDGGHRTMKAWRFDRGAAPGPAQEIEFGHQGAEEGATAAGLHGMQLHVPVASLYLPNDPPDDIADPLVIDLFYIRRVIEKAFLSENGNDMLV